MADASSTFNDADIQWTTATSKRGVSFEVGTKKEQANEGDTAEAERSPASFAAPLANVIPVRWTLGSSGSTSPEVQHRGIYTYSLDKNRLSPVIYEYQLRVDTKAWGHFIFYDESGDYYTLTTILNQAHYVRYNSSAPTIVGVE